MNTVDASVASQSETSRRSEIRTSSEGFISKNFDPFFDFITQFVHPHFIFYLVYLILITIQVIYVSMWVHGTTFWVYINDDKVTQSFSKLAQIIHFIAPLSPVYKVADDYLIPFIVYTVVVLILIISIIFQLLFYKTQRRFSKITLYPTRIFIEMFIPIMLIPLAHLTGHSFAQLFRKGASRDTIMYVYFVFGLVEYLICTVIFYYSSSIIGVSAYLSVSPLCCFDYRPLVHLVLCSSFFTIFETCFLIFPSWVIHPFIIFHIIITVFIGYELIFQPFISAKWNCFFFAIAIFSVSLDLLKLISNFFDLFEMYKDKENGNTTVLIINVVCFFGLFIASITASIIFSYKRFKKMKQSLSFSGEDNGLSPDSNLTEEYRTETFYKLKLDRSEAKALSVLYFVIQNHIVPYLDFVLIKFILNAHKSPHALMQCMRSISYFPANSRYLNMLFNIIVSRRDTKFTHRFFIYQIHKIKMLRQSSSSLIACEKLSELKTRTKELEEDVTNFWLINPNKESKDRCKAVNDHGVDATYLYQLQDRIDKTRALWEEALIDFPNSIPYRDEFCHFAVECQTDFAHAIKSKHKSDLIESGRNFNVDMAFRLFVRNFPAYLKKGIIDTKGNLIRASKKQGGGNLSHSSVNNSKNQSTLASSSTSMLNGQMEEEIGRSLITQSRIRLALQHSTKTKKADRFPVVVFVTIFLFILGLGFALFIFFYFKNYFNERSRSMIRIEMVNKIQLYTYTSALMAFYKWGNMTDQIHIDEFVHSLESKDRVHDPPFLDSIYYDKNLVYFNVQARDVLKDFLIDISELSSEGIDVFKYGRPLFESTTQLYFCNESHIFPPYLTNLKTALLFIFMSESQIANLENITLVKEMFQNNIDYCHIIQNLMYIYAPFQETRDLLIEMNEHDSKRDSNEIYKIKLALSVVYAVITVSLSCTFYFLYIREIMNFVQLLLNLPQDAKLNAMKPIRKNTESDSSEKDEKGETDLSINIHHDEPDMKGKYSIPLAFCIIIFICFMGNIILTYLQLENVETYNEKFYYLSNWVLLGRYRKVLIIRLTDWIMHLIMADNPMINGSFYINKTAFPELIDRNFAELNSATINMLEGHDGIPGSNNQDNEIDALTYQESCQTNESDPSYHELYQCGSLRNILIFFTNGIHEMIVNVENYNNRIDYRNDEVSAQLLHLVSNHALPRLNKIDERWDVVCQRYYDQFNQSHMIYMICSLVVVVIAFLLMLRLTIILSSAYKVCLLLLRRVSPIAIVNDSHLLSYLLDKTEEKSTNNSSTDQGIIKNSQDAIICLSSQGIIDMVNPAVNRLFGFTPEQLLGQPISTSLFDEKNGSQVTNQIFLMLNKQSSLSYEDHVICITDDDTEVPCQIMIFGMTSDNGLDSPTDDETESEDDEEKKKKKKNQKSGDIESFVVILRDESEMIKHQQIAEEAKKQSETLLYQILPRSIVIRLNQGEKDISFSVPSATIMFIDIAKFSDYASTLTPQEIMGNLSAIMGGYDDAIAKYDMLLKIKLIGDVYMCAGGLFNPDDPPASHAEQMVRFALDALQNIEDMNVKLSALLSVRIGINTGGPLIAGVLGTDKPTFDIIGDPINIASRLQSTDFPGRIQISQQTYDLVKDLDFQIEPRGEVYLKGKGNQPAYVVSPQSGISFSLSQMGENENLSYTLSNSFTKSAGSGQ